MPFVIRDCLEGIVKSSVRNSEKATGDNMFRFHPTRMKAGRGIGELLVGVLGIAGALAASVTAIAAGKAPVVPLQVPSSVTTPTRRVILMVSHWCHPAFRKAE
jgi:hypothetical protein